MLTYETLNKNFRISENHRQSKKITNIRNGGSGEQDSRNASTGKFFHDSWIHSDEAWKLV